MDAQGELQEEPINTTQVLMWNKLREFYLLGSYSYNSVKTQMLHRHIGFAGTNFTVASNLTVNINVSK